MQLPKALKTSPGHTTLSIMSPLKLLDTLLFLENILGVYRNYNGQKKIKKCFILFDVFIKTVMYSVVFIGIVYLLLGGDNGYEHLNLIYCGYCATAYITAVPSMISGVCYSSAFMSCYRSMTRVYDFFKDDTKFLYYVKKTYRIIMVMSVLYTAFGVLRFVEALIKFSHTNPFISISVSTVQFTLRMIIAFQYVVFFVVTMIVAHLSKCLLSLVLVVQESVSCDISSDEQCDVTGEQIQGWVELYRDLAKCCAKVTLCFGNQYFCLLLLLLSYFILLTYQFCYTSPSSSGGDANEYKKIIFVLFIYISLMIPPLVGGQLVKNQGVKLHRVLVRLYNAMIIMESVEVEAKLIKDFIRLIKKNPLEIKLVSKVPAGMYMLPVILTLSVNYLIVILQFNHII